MEGLCGGWATLQVAMSAYGWGCTLGVFYFGFAMASAVGAFLIRRPFIPIFSPAVGVRKGALTTTPMFYVAVLASFTNLMLALFLFLESLGTKAKGTLSPLLALTMPGAEELVASSVCSTFHIVPGETVTSPNGWKDEDWSMMLWAMVLFGPLWCVLIQAPSRRSHR
ncbi:hypothetical protein BD311DRAFT_367472 [Dichomitus squalens]|uniref:Uncharacterized protein n=1 Tax=Dichomitus squalens TaxID=114155 RepID=A0A4Q9MJT9_9APHY|nr:hypothetical protein BD311DRAFT_367472 [Dichomitus squalens]